MTRTLNASHAVRQAPPVRLAKLPTHPLNPGRLQLPAELTSGFEREMRGSMRLTQTPREGAKDVIQTFAAVFQERASDPRGFHKLMRSAYGRRYDKGEAENLRQRALAGDFSWMPPVRYLDAKTLQGGYGAFDADAEVIYLNKNLLAHPDLAVEVYAEELGHFLDSRLNTKDSAGDEGELFRRLLGGENLNARQIAAIRSEADHGVITVDGQDVRVEFWNPFKAIAKAAKSVGKAVVGAVKSVGKGVAAVVGGIADGAKTFVGGVAKGVGGFIGNAVRGRFGEAWGALGRGLDDAFIKAPTKAINGVVDSFEHLVNAPTYLLGSVGAWLRRGPLARVADATRNIVLGTWNAATGVVRNVAEAGSSFLGGLSRIVRGDFSGGFRRLGGSFVQLVQTPVDAVLLLAGKAASAVQTVVGLEPAGRRLTAQEMATLRAVYGDSLDYSAIRIKQGNAGVFSTNDRPFVLGNTIYMKDRTELRTLVHEACHVWQYQNGGTDYMSEALWSQRWGKGYNWAQSVPNTPWHELEPEQQAALLEEAWALGAFDPTHPSCGTFVWHGRNLTAYLRRAIASVRAGHGAP